MQIAKRILGSFGITRKPSKIKKTKKVPAKLRLPGWSPAFLAQLDGVTTVIDVGVLNGTPSLYRAFPDAYLVLVEPLPEYKPALETIIEGRRGEVHLCAAGAVDSEMVINRLNDAPQRSSLLNHVVGGSDDVSRITVPVRRLDALLAGRDIEEDILIKIDTEGFEMEVLKGAVETLKKTKFVIAEVSVRVRHEGSYRFSELASFLHENGFEIFDFLTVTRAASGSPGASIADTIFRNTRYD